VERYLGDALFLLPLIPDASFDAICHDPPAQVNRERKRDRKTERQTDRQRERKADRQTRRQIERERERERKRV